jgi:hypothetical protein
MSQTRKFITGSVISGFALAVTGPAFAVCLLPSEASGTPRRPVMIDLGAHHKSPYQNEHWPPDLPTRFMTGTAVTSTGIGTVFTFSTIAD